MTESVPASTARGADDYRNKHCALARRGWKPYRRCDHCTLRTQQCTGIQTTSITVAVAGLMSLFLALENDLLIRVNIALIVFLLLVLGYLINENLDGLARADFRNRKTIRDLQLRAKNLERGIHSRTSELERMLGQDRLTALANRSELEKALAVILDVARPETDQYVLCFLDLDQFKVINDTYGHVAGDELLRQLAPLLTQSVRETDLVARFGGDEFAVLFPHCELEDALEIVERIRRHIMDYRFSWRGATFALTVSAGVISISPRMDSVADLLANADLACFRAKELGRNRIQVFQYDTDAIQQRRGQVHWVSRITRALDENRLELFVQEIVPIRAADDGIRHFEVLIRLRDEQGNLVPPMAFLPAAERFNLMPRLDRWVTHAALEAFLRLDLDRPTALSINLSGASLTDPHLLDDISRLLDTYAVPTERICFEITETAAIANLHHATMLIKGLKAIGCAIALDDFGSGLSSFGYLKNFPVDYLKIDGSFVKDMLLDSSDRAMVEVINHIGHTLGKMTIAEFVESDAMIEELRKIGVDFGQGYGIGKPRSVSELVDALPVSDARIEEPLAEAQLTTGAARGD